MPPDDDGHYYYEGPGRAIEADAIEALTRALVELVEDIGNGGHYVVATNKAQFHRMLALVDSLEWTDRVTVSVSPGAKINYLMVFPKPADLAPPRYASRHRYGMGRCSHCAIRLPWYSRLGVELCRDCRPSLREVILPSGRVIPAGAPGPGRGFTRGSRWDG